MRLSGGVIRTCLVFAVAAIFFARPFPAEARGPGGDIEIAVAKAVRELDRERPAKALDILQSARKQYPESSVLAYYAGLSQIDLRDFASARASFNRALELDGEYVEPMLALGVLLYRDGKYEEAAVYLEGAARRSPENGRAHYWAGRNAKKLGRPDDAERFLAEAARLEEKQAGQGTGYGPERAKRYRISALIGLGYNDNVALEADGEDPTGSDEAAVFASLSVIGSYSLSGSRTSESLLYYSGYLSGHESLNQYDIQQHRGGAIYSRSFGDLGVFLEGGLEYTLVGGRAYRSAAEISPSVRFTHSAAHRTGGELSFRGEHYFRNEISPDNPDRSGTLTTITVTHDWRVSRELEVSAGLSYAVRSADLEERDHDGFEISLDGEYGVTEKVKLNGLISYESRDYDAGPSWPDGRNDDCFDLGAGISREITERYSVRIDYRYHKTDSDIDGYSYDQNVIRISLGVRI